MMQDGGYSEGVTDDTLDDEASQDKAALEAQKALVQKITKKIKEAKNKKFEKAFKRIREDMDIAYYGTSKTSYKNGKKYVANIIQRHVQQRVSSLYAKNPQADFTRRDRMVYKVWDGESTSIQQAMMSIQMVMQTYGVDPLQAAQMDPQSAAILLDYHQGNQKQKMLDNVGKTLVGLFQYYTDEQVPEFKMQMKQMVRRAVVTGVGYLKLDFQRSLRRNPGTQMHIESLQEQMDHMTNMATDLANEGMDESDPRMAEIELMMNKLRDEPLELDQEGLLFAFPSTTSIIVDPGCSQIQGFIGAGWVAEEHFFTPDEIAELWDIDLKGKGFTKYNKNTSTEQTGQNSSAWWNDLTKDANTNCCVWEFYEKSSGLRYFVLDGYCEFLEEPAAPNVSLERFYPYYTLVFNALEHENELLPPSDVRLLIPIQDDYNYSREGLREHRKAARPKYVTSKGAFEESDIDKLRNQEPHEVVQAKGLQVGQKVSDLIQQVPSAAIDQNLYMTNHLLEDMTMVAGAQEANLGGISGGSATETSIAETSRLSSVQSNIDDLDDFLSAIARDAGQVMLTELNPQTVQEIMGEGAVWPQMSSADIKKELYLKIQAGSSGRPNKAAELANIERVLPYLIQIPGIPPEWLAKEVLRRLDDKLDLSEAIVAGMPSISTLNAIAAKVEQIKAEGAAALMPAGGANNSSGSVPEQQGGQGANNAPNPQQTPPGPQPAFGNNNMPAMIG